MTSTQELIWKVSVNDVNSKATLSQIRAELTQTAQSQKSVNQGELSIRQQLAAVQSLQRQRSAALIADWKRTERAASNLAKGVQPVATNLQKVTEIMSALGNSSLLAETPIAGLTNRMEEAAGEASALSGSVGILIGGFVALAGVAAGAAIGIFELAEKTAKFGDDVFKAHEKTALSVETLSALKIAGRDVGVELSTMTTGFVRFTNNLEQAAAGNKKFVDIFGKLGVTAFHDNDKALQQFLTRFATLRTDQERVTAASQVFGLRFGANLVEVFNRVGGNMEAFKEQLRDVGLLLTDEDAVAAHQFSIDLERLETRLSGIGRIIGQETLPAFDAFFKTIEDSLKANAVDWQSWGDTLSGVILTTEALLGGVANVLDKLSLKNFIPIYGALKGILDFHEGVMSTADKLLANYNALVNPPIGIEASLSLGPRFGLPDEERKKKAKKAKDELAPYKAILDQVNRSLEFYGDKTEHAKIEEEFLRAGIEKLNPTLKAQAEAYKIVALAAATNIDLKKKIAEAEALAKRDAEKGNELTSQIFANQAESLREIRDGAKTAQDEVSDYEKEMALLGQTIDSTDLAQLRFNAALIELAPIIEALNSKALKEFNETIKQIEEGLGRLDEAKYSKIDAALKSAAQAAANAGGFQKQSQGVDSLTKAFDSLGDSIARAFGLGEQFGKQVSGLLKGAFDNLAQGIGSVVENYVLLGTTGPAVLRKILASALAQIAAESAVKAIYYTAQGFADLFFDPPKAAADFTAAALFASIAGVSALAGRAIAGNAFQPASSSAGSSSGRSASTSSSSAPAPIILGSQRQPVIRIVVEGRPGPIFNAHVVSAVVTDASTGGPMRHAIVTEIKRQE